MLPTEEGSLDMSLSFKDSLAHAGVWHQSCEVIRSPLQIDIFGETFPVPPKLEYEYVVATIDVKEQRLKLVHDNVQFDEFDYKLR